MAMANAASGSASTIRGIGLSVLTAGTAAAVINTAITFGAQAVGADDDVVPGLTPPTYIVFGIVGLLIAALAWSAVRARATDPVALMRWLVPTVVVISLIPDLLVGLAGMGWLGAFALVLMHLVVAAAGVTAFRHYLPLSRT